LILRALATVLLTQRASSQTSRPVARGTSRDAQSAARWPASACAPSSTTSSSGLRSPRSCPPRRSRDGERAVRAQTRAGEGGPADHLVSAAGHVEDTDHTERYRVGRRVVERSGRAWYEAVAHLRCRQRRGPNPSAPAPSPNTHHPGRRRSPALRHREGAVVFFLGARRHTRRPRRDQQTVDRLRRAPRRRRVLPSPRLPRVALVPIHLRTERKNGEKENAKAHSRAKESAVFQVFRASLKTTPGA